MAEIRVIPVLLCQAGRLVKSVRFRHHRYVGDPINAVRIFNEKEVDELILLDISATAERRKPDFNMVADIASEGFMPICYGGGIRELEDISRLLRLGVEKVSINSAAVADLALVEAAAARFGSQSVVVSVDVKKKVFGGYEVHAEGGRKRTGLDPGLFCRMAAQRGAGEILLNSIDRDGTKTGYDTTLLRQVSASLPIPVVACGGAGRLEDFVTAVAAGHASAVAAGSMFVFHGKQSAVLINYPQREELLRLFSSLR